jgi:hypothetical protein
MPNYEKPKTSPEELKEVEKKEVIFYDNKSIFEKMSDKAKKIASAVYEGVYQMPVANRIVGKMEIAYNQKIIDIYDKKMAKRKNKLDAIDYCLNIFETAEKELPEFKKGIGKGRGARYCFFGNTIKKNCSAKRGVFKQTR